jgi:hypothetical protein
MNAQIDISKVKQAVQKYCRTLPRRSRAEAAAPIDAALRKPLRNRADKCPGWNCKYFLHNI